MKYEPALMEPKWQKRWKEAQLFVTREEPGRPKFYGLDFFPYPSGAGLSVGHCRNYIPTDVLCRMKYMQGYNVLHPMGFDAFGLPAENEAIKKQTHPAPMVRSYGETYRRQMDLIGIGFDWSRSFFSSDPSYYKWTQWIFKVLYERGLAYRKLAAVNWDPVDQTVLADEEVIAGRAERSGALVEKRWIPQWFFKITEYAQRLIDDLDELDWPEGIKNQQRNWIGRSEGVEFSMQVVAGSSTGRFPNPDFTSGLHPVGEGSSPVQRELAESTASVQEELHGAVHTGETPVLRSHDEDFQIINKERELYLRVFTTRIDTVFGMSFCVLAPEHPLVKQIAPLVKKEQQDQIETYLEASKLLSENERQTTTREKTGVFTGAYAINPVNQKKVPLYIADYVLMGYGTGAIMAVPGHDSRDFEFAQKFDLPVIQVIAPPESSMGTLPMPNEATHSKHESDEQAPTPLLDSVSLPYDAKDGVLVNSGAYTGISIQKAQEELAEWFELEGVGERKVNYRLRDWLISRQRYWGCPIPVIHTKEGSLELVPDDCLPVELPQVENYQPSGDGSSPLKSISEFVNTLDSEGQLAQRETDTMGGFACSSWYFLRFCDPDNPDKAWDSKKIKYWMPVDCYVGGAEHAVMHLLYARFWTKVLYDAGLVPVKEPFQRLMNQGQVLAQTPYRKPKAGEKLDIGEEGILISFEEAKQLPENQVFWKPARMSKSKGNVVTPDEAAAQYGADALRVYELFVAPFEADVLWSEEGMQGAVRFLNRVFKIANDLRDSYIEDWADCIEANDTTELSKKIRRGTHQAIRKATEDIERFAFNTYISALMSFVNDLNEALKQAGESPAKAEKLAFSEALETLVLILAPAAPHSADEIWTSLSKPGFTYQASWPRFSEELAKEDTLTIAVQVNGKLRDTLQMPASSSKEELEQAALASIKVRAFLDGSQVKRVIVVPGRLVNVVVGE